MAARLQATVYPTQTGLEEDYQLYCGGLLRKFAYICAPFGFMRTSESTHLQADGSGGSRETSGTFVSLLSKHTLLTSRTGLSIASLGFRKVVSII